MLEPNEDRGFGPLGFLYFGGACAFVGACGMVFAWSMSGLDMDAVKTFGVALLVVGSILMGLYPGASKRHLDKMEALRAASRPRLGSDRFECGDGVVNAGSTAKH